MEGTPRESRLLRHEFGPRTPRSDSQPATPRQRSRHPDMGSGDLPQMLFREPSMIRISEDGERMVLQSSEDTENEAGRGFAMVASRRSTNEFVRKKQPHPKEEKEEEDDKEREEEEEDEEQEDEENEEEDEEDEEEEDEEDEEEEEDSYHRQQPEGMETVVRPWTVEESEDDTEDLNNLMILENLPRDDINYAQKIYRQLGLDTEPSPKSRGVSRQKTQTGTPQGKSNQSTPMKSSNTSNMKSLESTPRRPRGTPRQKSDLTWKTAGTTKAPSTSRKSKRLLGRKQVDCSPREDYLARYRAPEKVSMFEAMARIGLLRSNTNLTDIDQVLSRKTLHAQRPISRSATDLRPMREDSFYCVTNIRRRPRTTANMRSGDQSAAECCVLGGG